MGHPPLDPKTKNLGNPPDNKSVEGRVLDLIYGADYTIRPETGCFFETMGENPEMFVIGFAVEIPEHLGRPGTEINYICYTTHANSIKNRSIEDTINKLRQKKQVIESNFHQVEKFDDLDIGKVNISPIGWSEVPEREIAREVLSQMAPENRCDVSKQDYADGDNFGDSHDIDTKDQFSNSERNQEVLEVIALMWESFRRRTTKNPVRASLSEVDLFINNVQGSLSQLKYSSRLVDETIPEHFNVFDIERTAVPDYSDTFRFLMGLEPGTTLTWDTLPRFKDELHEIIERHQHALGTEPTDAVDQKFDAALTSDRFVSAVTEDVEISKTLGGYLATQVEAEDQVNSFYIEVWEEFERAYLKTILHLEEELRKQTRERFRAAVDPEYNINPDDGEDSGKVSKIIGDFSPFEEDDEDVDIETVVSQAKGGGINSAQLEKITERVLEENQALIDDIVQSAIEQELKTALESRASQRITELTEQAVENSVKVRATEAFEQTDDDHVWPS